MRDTIDPDIMEQARALVAPWVTTFGITLWPHEEDDIAFSIATAMQSIQDAERGTSYERAAQWHDKNARLCLEASKDDPRLNADDRRRAYEASRHHAASAASLRSIMIERYRQKIGGTNV